MYRIAIYLLGTFLILLINFSLAAQNPKNMYFVFLNTNPDRTKLPDEELEKLQAAHLTNIDSLYKTGDLIAAGPFNDMGGIFILVANDSTKASQLFNTDPAIQAKRFKMEYFPFKIDAGQICKYKEPAKLRSYGFIRWYQKPDKEIDRVQYERLMDRQYDYFTEIHLRDSMHFAGNFAPLHEGIVLFDLKSEDEIKLIFESSPMHNSGVFEYSMRKLWIAEGTFCKPE